jgi:hypothetical protein
LALLCEIGKIFFFEWTLRPSEPDGYLTEAFLAIRLCWAP